jgi:hypothetical protein
MLRDENNKIIDENYIWEKSFECGVERLHVVMSPVGIGSVYYMTSPNSAPIYGVVENMEQVLESNEPYKVKLATIGQLRVSPALTKLETNILETEPSFEPEAVSFLP